MTSACAERITLVCYTFRKEKPRDKACPWELQQLKHPIRLRPRKPPVTKQPGRTESTEETIWEGKTEEGVGDAECLVLLTFQFLLSSTGPPVLWFSHELPLSALQKKSPSFWIHGLDAWAVAPCSS